MVSLCSVIGLAALGAIALIATVTQASTDPISERDITVVHIADAAPPEETQDRKNAVVLLQGQREHMVPAGRNSIAEKCGNV
jgi:hypothetical protein